MDKVLTEIEKDISNKNFLYEQKAKELNDTDKIPNIR